MSCTVAHYWEEHCDNIRDRLAVVAEPRHSGSDAVVFQSSDGRKGLIDARLWFDEDAFVDVIEFVEIVDGTPHRTQYRYELVVDGAEVERVERDPFRPDLIHHRNRPLGDGRYTHEPVDPTSLKKYLIECWTSITEIRHEHGAES